ncbi:hypothetical protein GCM10010407_07170 [Rarobacter incanus]
MTPATRYETITAGPASAMPCPVPRNSPAPIAEPRPIMVRCRALSPVPRLAVRSSGCAGPVGDCLEDGELAGSGRAASPRDA